ncbi:hypothetical protein MHYP_G00063390 [Metynnis hypsauchen]
MNTGGGKRSSGGGECGGHLRQCAGYLAAAFEGKAAPGQTAALKRSCRLHRGLYSEVRLSAGSRSDRLAGAAAAFVYLLVQSSLSGVFNEPAVQ